MTLARTDHQDDHPDHDLVARLRDGDQEALATLVGRYSGRAYAQALRICRDPVLAEDAVQEAFVAFWRTPHRFDPARGSFSTWLMTLVRFKTVDIVRREEVRHRPDPADDGSEPREEGVDQVALARLSADRVRAALRTLPDPQRFALVLMHWGGYTQQEVADLAGVPLGTVKSRAHAGMARLRLVLQAEEAVTGPRRPPHDAPRRRPGPPPAPPPRPPAPGEACAPPRETP